jgi:hypothetical protein
MMCVIFFCVFHDVEKRDGRQNKGVLAQLPTGQGPSRAGQQQRGAQGWESKSSHVLGMAELRGSES